MKELAREGRQAALNCRRSVIHGVVVPLASPAS